MFIPMMGEPLSEMNLSYSKGTLKDSTPMHSIIKMKPSDDLNWHGLSRSEANVLWTSLRAFIRSLTFDSAQVDDIFQETVLRTRKSKCLSELDSPLAYMITVSKSVLYDFQRKSIPQADDIQTLELQSADESPDVAYLNQQKLDEVERILSAMAPLRRQVFLLRRIDGLSRDEIAEKLDISLEAVKNTLLVLW